MNVGARSWTPDTSAFDLARRGSLGGSGLLTLRAPQKPRQPFLSGRPLTKLRRRSTVPVTGGSEPASSAALLNLAGELLGRTWGQVSGLWGRKKTTWFYEEPHWVFLVNVLVIVLLRLGTGKLLVRSLSRGIDLIQSLYRRWRASALPAAEDAVPTVEEEAPPPAPALSQEEVSSLNRRWVKKMVRAAEAPLIVCMAVSMLCHVLVFGLQLLGTGQGAAWLASAINKVWVAQLLNYTLSGSWLVMRVLNTRLKLSEARPSLQGDLSNLRDSSPATSRRYAQEAAVTQFVRAAIFILAALLCLQHVGVNLGKLLALTSLSGVVFSFLVGDILNNLFGGFVLYLTQPFAQGDWVQSQDNKVDGWIQSLGWYYTTVMRWDKRPHYIPNSSFGSMPVANCSRMTNRRILFEGRLRMRDLAKVDDILADVRNLLSNHNDIDKDMHQLCGVKQIDEFGVKVWISCYTLDIRLAKYLQVQESVLLSVCGILQRHGTTWASELERFQQVGEDEEESAAAELRAQQQWQLLSARRALWGHERDLEEKEAKLEKQAQELQLRRGALEEQLGELEPRRLSLGQLKDLERTRTTSLVKRRLAISTKKKALVRRKEAIDELQGSIEAFRKDPEKALDLHSRALEMREESIMETWKAVDMERGAIESERKKLENQRELLEQKRLEADVETEVVEAEVVEEVAPPEEEVVEEEEAVPEGEQPPPDKREQAALAIGGE